SIQSFPSKFLVTSTLDTVSPVTLTIVAGGSTTTPIAEITGSAWIGNPYSVIIIISPMKPPPGIPLITIPDNKQMPIAVKKVSIPVKSILNTPNTKAIFNIAERQEPSICIVAPSGKTVSLMSYGTPILLAAWRFVGNAAILLPVPSEVAAGSRIFFQNRVTPFFPPAIKAYKVNPMAKYNTETG